MDGTLAAEDTPGRGLTMVLSLPCAGVVRSEAYDTTQNGKHALDYLTSFNRTETTADPCTGVSGVPSCSSPLTFPIPTDPNAIAQIGGLFTIYNGSISVVSGYTLSGTYTGTSQTSITVTFSPTANGTAVLAWGGHIATRLDWGVGNSAIAISGSPYHMRLIDFTCSNVSNCGVGNQDRSLSSEAVIFPAKLTITKDAVPDDPTDFGYTTTGPTLSGFSLDDDADGTLSNTKSFDLTTFGAANTRTVTEADPSPAFLLTGLTCTEDPGGLPQTDNSSTNLGTRTATIIAEEGEIIACTFTNARQPARVIVIKHVINDDGGTAAANAFTMTVDDPGTNPTSFPGAESPGTTVTVDPGDYTVTETGPSGYAASFSDDCTGTVAAGQTKTCTVTNNASPRS